MSKIISLQVQNIMRIKALKIETNEHDGTIIVSGKNGHGKSSTLDSIMMALCGGKKIPTRPVRDGEETAEIVVELDEYTVRRWWTSPSKSQIELRLKSGAKISNPQTELDNIVGNLAFDPLEFATMKSKDQLEMLRNISGLDLSKLDSEYGQLFAQRTIVKRDGDNFSSMMDTFKDVVDEKPEIDMEEIEQQRLGIAKFNQTVSEASNKMTQNNTAIDNNKRLIESTRRSIEQMEEQIRQAEHNIMNIELANEDLAPVASQTKKDTKELDESIAKWHAYVATQKQVGQKNDILAKLTKAREEWKKLDTRLKEILAEKEKLVKDANMPIEGLALGDGEILFKGIPFSQLSTSEQIRISMYVAMALNPKLRVAIIKNISLLDADAMKELSAIAKEKDFQVWCEKVADEADGNSIFIEDGEIK